MRIFENAMGYSAEPCESWGTRSPATDVSATAPYRVRITLPAVHFFDRHCPYAVTADSAGSRTSHLRSRGRRGAD